MITFGWREKEVPCKPHTCHWCGSTIDRFIVYLTDDGEECDWPRCPECKGC